MDHERQERVKFREEVDKGVKVKHSMTQRGNKEGVVLTSTM